MATFDELDDGGKGNSSVRESVQNARLGVVLRAIFVSATYVTNFLSGAFLDTLVPCVVGKGCSIFSNHNIPNDCGVLGEVLLFLVQCPATLDWLRALGDRRISKRDRAARPDCQPTIEDMHGA